MPVNPIQPDQVNEDTLQDADNNTKIQVEESPNENKIRFDTAGAERMIIDSNGKVGIGTASLDPPAAPSKELDVVGDIKTSDSLYTDKIRRATDNGTTTKIKLESNQVQIYAAGNASDPKLTVNSAGLKLDCSFAGAYTSYSADDFSATGSHFIIDWTGTSSATNVTLPTPNNIAGRIYHILNTSSSDQSNLTVDTVQGVNFIGSHIDNGSAATVVLSGGGPQSITVVSTHNVWFVLHDGRFPPNDP